MIFFVQRTQQGTALITSLLMVFVISILGVAVSQQVASLRKTSTLNYDQSLSSNRAESVLTEAHSVIAALIGSPEDIEEIAEVEKSTSNWWRTDSEWDKATAVTEITEGEYLIEDLGATAGSMGTAGYNEGLSTHFYRVTVKAQGKGESIAFLQTIYGVME